MADLEPKPASEPTQAAIPRRRLLQAGGVAVALSAMVAACSDDDGDDRAKRPRPPQSARHDITITRTASSLELVAVTVYTTLIESGLITTPGVLDLAQRFGAHHEAHAELFARLTRSLGGRPFDEVNPAVLEQFKPFLNALQDEAGVVALALNLENIVSHTYQAYTGALGDPGLAVTAMGVGGVEARHAAAMAAFGEQPAVPGPFQDIQQAVVPGTGL